MRLLGLLLLLATLPASAGVRVYGNIGVPAGEGLELSLDLAHTERELETAGRATELRGDRLGVELVDYRWGALQPGLRGGVLAARQSGDPIAGGIELDGHYFGVLLRSELFAGRPVGLRLGASYTYHSADGSEAGQDVELRWYEAEGRAAAVWRLGRVHWLAGAYAAALDGEQHLGGAVARDVDLEEGGAGGFYGGLDYLPEAGARISARLTSGERRQFSVSFAREF